MIPGQTRHVRLYGYNSFKLLYINQRLTLNEKILDMPYFSLYSNHIIYRN
ncbi:hypothetical protein LCGC14_1794880 [marine sediment metagenome]|uniref:Uncharacterized protein n=1 Tax=marine sediment metagenome TaxID=412755 RepID=A0A0F9GRE9_9ZZZZ